MTATELLISAAVSAVVAGAATAQTMDHSTTLPTTNMPTMSMETSMPASIGMQAPAYNTTIAKGSHQPYSRKTTRSSATQLFGGQFVSPLSSLSGGRFGHAPVVVPLKLDDPGAVGAAAKVKLDRAGVDERIQSVKYLATVDCHYWPEVEEALIGALRADRNECVRYEAAVTLGSGCCCTPRVVVALSHCVSCSDADGNPTERSGRVRSAAAAALQRCLQSGCCAPSLPTVTNEVKPKATTDDKKTDDKKTDDKKPDDKKKAQLGEPGFSQEYYQAVGRVPREKVADLGMRALDIGNRIGYPIDAAGNASDFAAAGIPPAGSSIVVNEAPRSILDLFNRREVVSSLATRPLVGPANGVVPTMIYPSTPTTSTVVMSRPANIPQMSMPQTAMGTPAPEVTFYPTAPTPAPVYTPRPVAALASTPKPLESRTTTSAIPAMRITPPTASSPAVPVATMPSAGPSSQLTNRTPVMVPTTPVATPTIVKPTQTVIAPAPAPVMTVKPVEVAKPVMTVKPVEAIPVSTKKPSKPLELPKIPTVPMAESVAPVERIAPRPATPVPLPTVQTIELPGATPSTMPPVERFVPQVSVPTVPSSGDTMPPVERFTPQAAPLTIPTAPVPAKSAPSATVNDNLPPVEKFTP